MKKSKQLIFLSLLLSLIANAQFKTIKVACVGNSITYGGSVDPNRMLYSYPAQLGQLLSYQWDVNNFGKNTACIVHDGAVPYMKQPEFTAMMAYLPDVVTIKLGTNDGLSEWKHKDEFERDYNTLVDTIAHLSSKPKIYLCRPCFTGRVENKIIQDSIYPVIQRIALQRGLEIIDLYTPLANNPNYFIYDVIHPNKTGYGLLAKVIADKLTSASQSMNLSKTILANKMTIVSGTGSNFPDGYIGNAVSGLKVSLGTINFDSISYNHVFVKTAFNASTSGTFDFYLDSQAAPFASAKAMTTGGLLTFLTSTGSFQNPITGSHQVYIVWNGQSSNLLMAGLANYTETTPLNIAASSMANLNSCSLSADGTNIGSAVDGSSVILGDSIDFGNGSFNKVTSTMFLTYGDIYGQRTGELDLYIDNQTTPFASLRIHLPIQYNTDYSISKRFDKIIGKHKVKVVWDWYVANLKNITFSFESGPILTQQKEIKIACLGNSITEGTDAGDRVNKGYVGLLEQLLGERYQVRNYGLSGSTACRGTSKPFVTSNFSSSAQNFQPDIVTIGLGTNDSQTSVWNVGTFAANFKADYAYLVDLFVNLKSKPKVYACLPPPIFPSSRWTHQPDTLANKIIPEILQVANEKNLNVIDFYSPMINHNEYYAAADQLHPLDIGHQVMADQVYKAILGNVSTKAILDSLKQLTNRTDTLLAHTVIGTTPGTYSASAKSALLIVLNASKAINGFNTAIEINQSIIDLTNALKSFKLSFNYSTNTLPVGDYYIKKTGTNLFWTNTGLNKMNINYFEEKPVFNSQIIGSNDQVFHISLLTNGRYRIDSKSDVPAYINESAKIRRDFTNFYTDWNTVNILYNGSAYAVQPAGSAASAGFWILVSDVVTASGIIALNKETNFILDFVNASPTEVQSNEETKIKVISLNDGIQVINNKCSKISIYYLNGSLVKSITTNGDTIIPLLQGLYLVKVLSEDTLIQKKILVK